MSISRVVGVGTGPIALAPVGSAPNAYGMTLIGSTLNLEPADIFNPGIVTSGGSQVFGGDKSIFGDFAVGFNLEVGLFAGGGGGVATFYGDNGRQIIYNSKPGVLWLFGGTTGDTVIQFQGGVGSPTKTVTVNFNANTDPQGTLSLQRRSLSDVFEAYIWQVNLSTLALTFGGAISATNLSGTNTGDVTLAPIGAVPNANAASLAGQVLTLQPASTGFGGVVTTGAQSFAGAKTFTGAITASNLSGTNTGDVTLGAIGAVPNANAASLAGQVLTLQPASISFGGVVTTGAQSFAGNKTFTGTIASDGTVANDVRVLFSGGSGAPTKAATINFSATGDAQGTWSIQRRTTAGGFEANMFLLNLTTGNAQLTGTFTASNLSGTNTGDITLGAIGATPNANAASLVGQVLTLQPASVSFGGIVTTGAQTFSGDKTFNGNVILSTASSLNCGSQTRQMLNLWSTVYGIGVQSSTEYFRTSAGFAWFAGGVHSDTTNDPGAGGTKLMDLSGTGNLTILGNIAAANFPGAAANRPLTVISANTNMVSNNDYLSATSSLTHTLPAAPAAGDMIRLFQDSAVTGTIINPNGKNIESTAGNMTIDIDGATISIVYTDATRGWMLL